MLDVLELMSKELKILLFVSCSADALLTVFYYVHGGNPKIEN